MEKDQAEDQAPDTGPVRLAFRTCYLGDRFFGSQMQDGIRTVEGEFVSACVRLELFDDWRSAGFLGAGRTDRGVHARGQVYAFTTRYPGRAVAALNWQLPRDCWCTGYARTAPGFHPRYDARERTYRYYFGRDDLDTAAMDRAARLFCGNHDFSGLSRASGKNPFRCVTGARVAANGTGTYFEVSAGSFLWHMVRYMARALLLVGEGNADESLISRRLSGNLAEPLGPAPPGGVVLWEVDCGLPFLPMEPDGRSRSFVAEERAGHAVMLRVCDALAGTGTAAGGREEIDRAL
jgi:tRNA pseudouridine38-40 synthase